MYFLTFSAHFDRDKGLDLGRLCLRLVKGGEGETIKIWMAATSTAGKQQPESFHRRNHMLPPEYRIPGLKSWTVDTNPIHLPHVLGVQGNFYRLLPYSVTTDQGGKRGDFGIHWDGNSPGSAGCIVMSKDRFNDFEKVIADLRKTKGIKKLPLFVTYS